MHSTTFKHKYKKGDLVYTSGQDKKGVEKGHISRIEFDSLYGVKYWVTFTSRKYDAYRSESEVFTNVEEAFKKL